MATGMTVMVAIEMAVMVTGAAPGGMRMDSMPPPREGVNEEVGEKGEDGRLDGGRDERGDACPLAGGGCLWVGGDADGHVLFLSWGAGRHGGW